jgi:radical SAM protein with 4Fe4S-binding SPASM domain
LKAYSFIEYHPSHDDGVKSELCALLHLHRPRWIIGNAAFNEIACLLIEQNSIHAAASIIADRHGVAVNSIIQDIRQVEDQLRTHHLLEHSEPGASIRTPQLKNLFVYLTDRCNLACSHCYYTGAAHGDFPADRFNKMADQMVEMGGTLITFTGGEALLHPSLRELISYVNGRCAISLLTNGTLLDLEWARFLSSMENIHVQISIDGSCSEIHDAIRGRGAFEKALKAIDYLQKAGLADRVNLSATVMARNLHDLPGIIELGEQIGVPSVRFVPLRKLGRASDKDSGPSAAVSADDYAGFFDYVLRRQPSEGKTMEVICGLSGFLIPPSPDTPADDIWCPLGHGIVVNPRGDAYPCTLLQTEEFFLGNVFRDGLASSIASDRLSRACALMVERKNKIDDCAQCTWRNFCQAGCMGEAFEEHGTIWEKGKFCSYRKALYAKAFNKLCRPACTKNPASETSA